MLRCKVYQCPGVGLTLVLIPNLETSVGVGLDEVTSDNRRLVNENIA